MKKANLKKRKNRHQEIQLSRPEAQSAKKYK